MTGSGLAVFIVIADDVWDSTQSSWLTTQLNDADTHAKYTFVSRHHPIGNTDYPDFQTIDNVVRKSSSFSTDLRTFGTRRSRTSRIGFDEIFPHLAA